MYTQYRAHICILHEILIYNIVNIVIDNNSLINLYKLVFLLMTKYHDEVINILSSFKLPLKVFVNNTFHIPLPACRRVVQNGMMSTLESQNGEGRSIRGLTSFFGRVQPNLQVQAEAFMASS